jgi:hypothetical protein
LLHQYSLSEYNGHLRVATTTMPHGRCCDSQLHATESAVTVLARKGTELVAVGRLASLGNGERIYAVRRTAAGCTSNRSAGCGCPTPAQVAGSTTTPTAKKAFTASGSTATVTASSRSVSASSAWTSADHSRRSWPPTYPERFDDSDHSQLTADLTR